MWKSTCRSRGSSFTEKMETWKGECALRCRVQACDTSFFLPQYIEGLDDRLMELHMLTACQPSREQLLLFTKKVRTLKGVIEAEKLKSASERLAAVQIMPPVSTSSGLDRTQEIFCQTRSKYSNQVREELFSGAGGRRELGEDGSDVDLVMNFQRERQEKMAEEMVALAHNLKENLHIAGDIVKNDTRCLEGTSQLAEDNTRHLRSNADKLTDFVRRSCQYWLWILLALNCFAFLWMVVFIRMFPKKAY